MYEKDTLKVYDRVCDGNICGAGGVVIAVEDIVRLSAYMVDAIYALFLRARRLYRWVQYDDTAIYHAPMGSWLRVWADIRS